MRIPTFSRHSASDTADEHAAPANRSTVDGPDDATTAHFPAVGAAGDRAGARGEGDQEWAGHDRDRTAVYGTGRAHDPDRARGPEVMAGPKPRASLMATLGLILGVASALLVLSGPLLGYGIGLAVLALVLSLAGTFATRRRHVAGKSDALIGMVLSLGAIVVGVLALTGSLSWLGTDTQSVTSLREWLDAQFVDRF